MADAFGAAAAAVGLLQGAINIVSRIRNARQQERDFCKALDRHAKRLEVLKSLVEIVHQECALHTQPIAEQLKTLRTTLEDIEERLKTGLAENTDPSKGSFRKVVRRLMTGSKANEMLVSVSKDLDDAQHNLTLTIQHENVGLMQVIGDKMILNSDDIKRVDKLVRELLGSDKGLAIAKMLERSAPQDNGTCSFSKAEINRMKTTIPNQSSDLSPRAKRIIERNEINGSGSMYNGPIGVQDNWKEHDVTINDNKSFDNGTMVNYAIEGNIFDRILKEREATAIRAEKERAAIRAEEQAERAVIRAEERAERERLRLGTQTKA